jgi:hypothetical protein
VPILLQCQVAEQTYDYQNYKKEKDTSEQEVHICLNPFAVFQSHIAENLLHNNL